MSLEEEFKQSSDLDDNIDFSSITPERVFASFTDSGEPLQQQQVRYVLEESKQGLGKPIEVTQDVDSDDEDEEEEQDDGDFKVRYR